MDDSSKRELIAAKRGPLEQERFAAELDVEVAEVHGDDAVLEEPKSRLERINKQLQILDDKESDLED